MLQPCPPRKIWLYGQTSKWNVCLQVPTWGCSWGWILPSCQQTIINFPLLQLISDVTFSGLCGSITFPYFVPNKEGSNGAKPVANPLIQNVLNQWDSRKLLGSAPWGSVYLLLWPLLQHILVAVIWGFLLYWAYVSYLLLTNVLSIQLQLGCSQGAPWIPRLWLQ